MAQNIFQHLDFDLNHSLSLDATIIVSKTNAIIGEHVIILTRHFPTS